ncbi:MAG: DNA mismatch repair endonuclease MutL [Prevotella sp.]|nr:DNA mismatch repair endonuclease MutL [Prevotella sp.]
MDTIHLLPDSVANQIAAGEVIQRPASVVKELVENAVDAGAHRIDIVAVDAGRTSLQVIDDGKGMSETDARMAFERHATSKIQQAADLFTLTTMGFRGEALPSIASVAQVELTTRMADSELGTHLVLEGSRVVSQEPTACAVGANFIVKNLFFNVPARRKFLKTNQTELSNITTELERIVLVHPDIAFTLTHNGSTLLSLTPSGLKQRIASVFGNRLADSLLPVEVETPMVSICGFVGKPEASRKRGLQQYFFVNNRYMRHPYFHRAVQEAFARLIPSDEQVPYFIYFDVPPADIDVNIHPTKTEIKFENEQAIWQILLAAVREALGRFNAVPTIDFDTEGRPADIPVFNPLDTSRQAPLQPPTVKVDPTFNPFKSPDRPSRPTPDPSRQGGESWRADGFPNSNKPPQNWETLYQDLSQPERPTPAPSRQGGESWRADGYTPNNKAPENWETLYQDLSQPEDQLPSLTGGVGGGSFGGGSFGSSTFFQYLGTYLLTAVENGLMFIDQHRAHIRILYDRYISQMGSTPLPSQHYLFPEVMELSPADAATFAEIEPQLQHLGFDVNDLGGGAISIIGYPAGLDGVDIQRLLVELLAAVADRGTLTAEQLFGKLALTLARAAAIPVGQVLSQTEMHDLVEQLFATTSPNYTPDGHLIVSILPQDTIEKLFK